MTTQIATTTHDFEVFYDGGCPLCRREIALLQKWDRRQRIRFTDIDAPGFDPTTVGRTHQELMDQIHGRLPSGELVTGVEVFRQLYAAVGFGPLVSLTRLPGIAQMLNLGYHIFSKNRLRLTGRCQAGECQLPTS